MTGELGGISVECVSQVKRFMKGRMKLDVRDCLDCRHFVESLASLLTHRSLILKQINQADCGQDPAGREVVTIAEAAQLCMVSVTTVYRWMQGGRLEWLCDASGYRRIYKDTLIRSREEVGKSCVGGDDQRGCGSEEGF
jgi:hypothetical protein